MTGEEAGRRMGEDVTERVERGIGIEIAETDECG